MILLGSLFMVIVVIFVVILNSKLSTITTNQPNLYQVKLVDISNQQYDEKIKVPSGRYQVSIQGPYNTQPEIVEVGFLRTKTIDMGPLYSERGVDQVIEERLKDYGIFYTEVSDCQEIETLYFVCQYYRASSIKPVEARYLNHEWEIKTDIAQISNPVAQNRFNEILSRNSHR